MDWAYSQDGETGKTNKILVGKHLGTWSVRRPRERWEDNLL